MRRAPGMRTCWMMMTHHHSLSSSAAMPLQLSYMPFVHIQVSIWLDWWHLVALQLKHFVCSGVEDNNQPEQQCPCTPSMDITSSASFTLLSRSALTCVVPQQKPAMQNFCSAVWQWHLWHWWVINLRDNIIACCQSMPQQHQVLHTAQWQTNLFCSTINCIHAQSINTAGIYGILLHKGGGVNQPEWWFHSMPSLNPLCCSAATPLQCMLPLKLHSLLLLGCHCCQMLVVFCQHKSLSFFWKWLVHCCHCFLL